MEDKSAHDIEINGMAECWKAEGGCETGDEDDIMMRQPLLLRNRTNNTSQIAFVGSNVYPIESLDYEIIENDLFKQDWRSRKKGEIFQYVVLKWTFALLIGISTGLVGFFNNLAVENIAGFKLLLINNLILKQKYIIGFIVYAGCNMTLAFVAATLCAFVAPAAAGSGIPEVKAYLNGIDAHSILAPTTLFVKIFGSILGVAAGFVIGKEGPMVHTGACIASLLGQGGSHKYHLTWKWLKLFKNDSDRRDLVTCGAAAGVAAAFRAPVGGVLFALEEAASWWRSALLWRTFFTTAVVAVVLRTLMQYCMSGGVCGLFGEGGLIMFDVNSSITDYNIVDLLVVTFLAILGGLLGSLYNHLVHKILGIYTSINEKGPVFKIGLVIAVSMLTSLCSYGLPLAAYCSPCPGEAAGVRTGGECRTAGGGRSGNFNDFNCPPAHYNDLASLLLTTNDDSIRNLLTPTGERGFRLSTLLVFFVTVYPLGVITYGIAVPSGLFIPVILAGACYGRLVGGVVEGFCDLDGGFFAVLGAASFLGGTMRMTVSLCVILLELTNDLVMLPLVMLVLLISKTVGDCFNKGIYDEMVRMKGMPYMEAHTEPYMKNLTAGDAVSGPVVWFSEVERVGVVWQALKTTTHNGFPVIGDGAELCGLVLRSHLLVLLKGRVFGKGRERMGEETLKKFGGDDFAKAGSGKGMKVEDLDLGEEEMEMFVDLHPIINTSPYTVLETMSLAKAAILFRRVGLRHLCVLPKRPGAKGPPIVGILTRHDFMPEHVDCILGKSMDLS